MKINENRLFPYPVLRDNNNNFIHSKFKVDAKYRILEDGYEIETNTFLENDNLIKLIKEKKVSIVLHLECSKTKYRKIENLNIGDTKINIKTEFLEGKLELLGLLISEEKIKDYLSKDFHPNYEDKTFEIEKGSILGISEIPSIIIENKKEEYSSIPSIFDVTSNSEMKYMELKLDGERIIIVLPLEIYKIRNANKNSLHSRNIVNSMILSPALMGTLYELLDKEAKEMYGNKRWFRVINSKLSKLNIDLEEGDLYEENIFSIAQSLLEDLLDEGMASLKYLGDEE
jgi:hypothetical protein